MGDPPIVEGKESVEDTPTTEMTPGGFSTKEENHTLVGKRGLQERAFFF